MNTLDIYVRYSAGAYSTNRIGKLSASSTSSAQSAAERLADKLFGPALQRIERVGDEVNCASVWRVTADASAYAYCWATGEIEFGDTVPIDAIAFAKGPLRALKQRVAVLARHGYKPDQLLVPGVPEAPNQNAGMDALVEFTKWAAKANGEPRVHRVVFGPQAVLDAS